MFLPLRGRWMARRSASQTEGAHPFDTVRWGCEPPNAASHRTRLGSQSLLSCAGDVFPAPPSWVQVRLRRSDTRSCSCAWELSPRGDVLLGCKPR